MGNHVTSLFNPNTYIQFKILKTYTLSVTQEFSTSVLYQQYLRLSEQCWWRFQTYRIMCCVSWYAGTDWLVVISQRTGIVWSNWFYQNSPLYTAAIKGSKQFTMGMNFKLIQITLIAAKCRLLVVMLMMESSYNCSFGWEISWYQEKDIFLNISVICINRTWFPVKSVYISHDLLYFSPSLYLSFVRFNVLISSSSFGQFAMPFPCISCSCSSSPNLNVHFSLMKWPA